MEQAPLTLSIDDQAQAGHSPPIVPLPRDPRTAACAYPVRVWLAHRSCTERAAGQDAAPLTSRAHGIVRLVAADQSSKTIARTLDISPQTVDTHRYRLLRTLDLHCAAAVVRYALRSGLLARAAGGEETQYTSSGRE